MKNKMKILMIGLCTMLASATFVIAQDQEVPGMGGDGDRIICHCTILANCKVSGSSGVCAQSEPGGNIQCSVYNSNC